MSSRIRFYLDGEYHQAESVAPTTTVLEYLREHLGVTAAKEGCAEGDCGACTVVLAELQGEHGLHLRSVNACIQFLPTLDGRAVFTADGLADGDRLHPVQQAMVDCHGSQCGFCTPGFVMSLFALFKSTENPARDEVNHALAGNLCRCTGYRPIIDAAQRMYVIAGDEAADDWRWLPGKPDAQKPLPSEQALIKQLEQIQREDTLQLDDAYYAPVTEDNLAALVVDHPDATILAGGTDVGLWVTKDYRDLPKVIYLGDVAELKTCTVTEEAIEIGAGVNLTDAFALLQKEYPDLDEIIRRYASPPICNAGTLVGNVANGSPIGDSMPALICLESRLRIRRGENQREMPLDEFYLGYQQKALEPGEYVSALLIPRARPGSYLRSYKIGKRFDQDISGICGAFHVSLDGGRVTGARICYGGMAEVPRRALTAEQALMGQGWSADTVAEGMQALEEDFSPISDMRASADYRGRVAANLLMKFFHDTQPESGARPNRVFGLERTQ